MDKAEHHLGKCIRDLQTLDIQQLSLPPISMKAKQSKMAKHDGIAAFLKHESKHMHSKSAQSRRRELAKAAAAFTQLSTPLL